MELLLENFRYYDDNDVLIEDHSFLIKNGFIQEILEKGSGRHTNTVDMQGNLLVPGFVDLQVNGGNDVFFTNSIQEEVLRQMDSDHLKAGTTRMLPTLVSTSPSNILKGIDAVRKYMHNQKSGILGMHLEGPFLDYGKRGAHNPKYVRKPTDKELKSILEAGKGVIRILTIAPELFTDEQLDLIQDYGITIFAGHSNITYASAMTAFSKGVSGVTHLYNAMSQMGSRELGLVGATLDSDVDASIVVDGYHCDYAAVRLAYKLKKEKLFLVSDATFIGVKNLEMDGIQFIHQPGRYVNSEGNLAGSNITMLDAVRNTVRYVGVSLPTAIKMATTIPYRVLKLEKSYGKLAKNYHADILVLSPENLALKKVMRNGLFI